MSYWVIGRVDSTSEAASAASIQDAAREARRLAERGAENLKIIGPDLQALSLEEIERSLRENLAQPAAGA
jgi:hypothetical protein